MNLVIPITPADALVIEAYSPYQHIENQEYPPTMVITADHDNRVAPAHSYKFVAALEEVNAPVHLRLIKGVGHSAEKACTSQVERRDRYFDLPAQGAAVMQPFIEGVMLSAGLIVAIGAQNAFVIRQGVQGHHVLLVALTCIFCDTLLISMGALGLGGLISASPKLRFVLILLGIGFLGWYGTTAWMRALRKADPKQANLQGKAATHGGEDCNPGTGL